MRIADAGSLALSALRENRLRSTLSVLSVAIGITAVILMTSIGEGVRRYVMNEFLQFGTDLFQINPGRTETAGLPGVFGGTTRKLTVDDAQALERVPGVEIVLPVVMGQGRVEGGGLGRSVSIFGVTPDAPELWTYRVRRGRFLVGEDLHRARYEAVLGATLARELFGTDNVVGRTVRVAGTRLRVVGVLAPRGRVLGFDMDDLVFVPVATGLRLFNMDELMEIDVRFSDARGADRVVADVKAILTERHAGHEDFTITTQAQMLSVLDRVMNGVTVAVAAIAAISLLVGGVGILTTTWISVGERTQEIGLMRAVGSRTSEVRLLFLLEASCLAGAGGVLGLAAGVGIVAGLRALLPGLPAHAPPAILALAFVVSVAVGLASGITPAQRAARLDPVEALRAE